MSEIETSEVERAAIALRMSGHHTKAILIQALAAERDALAARVAKAERMAEALGAMVSTYAETGCPVCNGDCVAAPSPVSRCPMDVLHAARTALAAWRAAEAPPCCPACIDETDCSSVAVCRAVAEAYGEPVDRAAAAKEVEDGR